MVVQRVYVGDGFESTKIIFTRYSHISNFEIKVLTSAFVRTFFTLPGLLRVKPLGVAVPELERLEAETSLVGPDRSNFLKRSPEVADNLRTSGR